MIAILIDAENVNPIFAEQIFARVTSCDDEIRSEIYGTAPALANWSPAILKYAIDPHLTICASKGKNTSDIALAIGAMDLLSTASSFLICSSDSDFSALALRLRKEGKYVTGLGTGKANPLWMQACTEFVTLVERDEKEELRAIVAEEIEKNKDENGWAYLGDITITLKKTIPAFSPANYGFHSVTPLVVSLGFEAEKRRNGQNVLMYVREKQDTKPQENGTATQLKQAGFTAEEADGITACFALAPDMRKVFNAMRKRFGSALGKEYYNRAKALME